MKNLTNIGVQELTQKEITNMTGGWWPAISLLIGAINDAYNNPDDFKAGFDAVYN